MFQMITALEPSRDMVEVALVSMKYAMGIEVEPEKAPEPGPPAVG